MNKKIFSTLFLMALTVAAIFAQPSFYWERSIISVPSPSVSLKKPGNARVYGTTIDTQGNVYAVGYFDTIVDFDPTSKTYFLKSKGGEDAYVAKYAANGNLLWANGIGAKRNERLISVKVDSQGNVFVGGYVNNSGGNFTSSNNHDSTYYFYNDKGNLDTAYGNSPNIQADGIYIKYDANGKYLFSRAFGDATTKGANDDGSPTVNSLDIDQHGNVYLVGTFNGAVDFDPTVAGVTKYTSYLNNQGIPSYAADIFLSKFDKLGKLVFAYRLGGVDIDYGNGIAVGKNGEVVITGIFCQQAGFDGKNATAQTLQTASNKQYDQDAFLCKYDTSGNFIWVKQIGDDSLKTKSDSSAVRNQYGLGVAVSSSGDVFVGGNYDANNMYVDRTSVNKIKLVKNGSSDFYIAKFNANGNVVWANGIGGTTSESFGNLAIDPLNNVYVTGLFSSLKLDFDPTTAGQSLIIKTRTDNDIFMAKYDGSGKSMWARSYGSLGDYDPSNNTYGGDDWGTSIAVNQSNYDIALGGISNGDTISFGGTSSTDYFINPRAGHLQGYLVKFKGCMIDFGTEKDSLVMADVYKTYQWYDCATGLKIDGATKIDFKPKNSGNYKIVVTGFEGCVDTSDCYSYVGCSVDVTTTRNVDTLKVNQTGATYQWLVRPTGTKKYVAIAGQSKQYYILTNVSAEYACKITLSRGCSDTTAFVLFKDVSVLESYINANIVLSPNPAQKSLTVQLLDNFNSMILSVYDISGQEVIAPTTITKNSTELNIENLSNGFYTLKLTETKSGIIGTKKFIKQE